MYHILIALVNLIKKSCELVLKCHHENTSYFIDYKVTPPDNQYL